jgi:O-antigen/teichoic acid export membrane protein
MGNISSIKKSSLSVFFTRQGIRILALVTGIIIARVLGPAGRGVIALVLLVPSVIMQFSNLGMDVANTYFTSKRKIDFKKLFGNSIIFPLLLSTIILFLFLITYIVWKYLFFSEVSTFYILLALPLLPLWLLTSNLKGIVLGEKQYREYNIGGLIESTVLLVLIFVFLVLLNRGISFVIISYTLAAIVVGAFFFSLFRSRFPKNIRLNGTVLKEQIGFGIKPYLANLFSFLNFKVDLLLIAFYLNIESVGFYALATGLIQKVRDIPSSIQTVFFPEVTSKTDSESNQITQRVYRSVFLIMVVVGILLAILARPLIHLLYGREFLPSVVPFIILIGGCVIIRGNVGILSTSLAGRGKPEYAAVSNGISLVLNIILNIIMIPRWGILGAAIATSISAFLNSLLLFGFYIFVTKTRPLTLLKFSRSDVSDIFRFRITKRESR